MTTLNEQQATNDEQPQQPGDARLVEVIRFLDQATRDRRPVIVATQTAIAADMLACYLITSGLPVSVIREEDAENWPRLDLPIKRIDEPFTTFENAETNVLIGPKNLLTHGWLTARSNVLLAATFDLDYDDYLDLSEYIPVTHKDHPHMLWLRFGADLAAVRVTSLDNLDAILNGPAKAWAKRHRARRNLRRHGRTTGYTVD